MTPVARVVTLCLRLGLCIPLETNDWRPHTLSTAHFPLSLISGPINNALARKITISISMVPSQKSRQRASMKQKASRYPQGSGTPIGTHQFLSPSESGCVVSSLSPGGRTCLESRLLTRHSALWCCLPSLLYSCLYFCSLATVSSVPANPSSAGDFTLLCFSLSKSPANQKAFQCCEVLVANAASGCLGFQTF